MDFEEALQLDWALPPEADSSGWMRDALRRGTEDCLRRALAYCAIEDSPQPDVAIDYLAVVLARVRGEIPEPTRPHVGD